MVEFLLPVVLVVLLYEAMGVGALYVNQGRRFRWRDIGQAPIRFHLWPLGLLEAAFHAVWDTLDG